MSQIRVWLYAAILIFFAFFHVIPSYASRDMPDDNLAYPVLITSNGNSRASSGTGFYLNEGRATFLVTARHVLFKDSETMLADTILCRSYSKDFSDPTPNIISLNLAHLNKLGEVKAHKVYDIAVVRIGRAIENKVKMSEGVSSITHARAGIIGVATSSLKMFEKALVGNEIFLFGYPVSLGMKETPLFDYSRPLLRKGVLAGKHDSRKTLILDLPAYPGNSGGPVLEVETDGPFSKTFRVVGVVTDFIPTVETWTNTPYRYENHTIGNSGYSVAVSMDAVLELISGFSW